MVGVVYYDTTLTTPCTDSFSVDIFAKKVYRTEYSVMSCIPLAARSHRVHPTHTPLHAWRPPKDGACRAGSDGADGRLALARLLDELVLPLPLPLLRRDLRQQRALDLLAERVGEHLDDGNARRRR